MAPSLTRIEEEYRMPFRHLSTSKVREDFQPAGTGLARIAGPGLGTILTFEVASCI
jgi:hypothetical protein